MILGNLDRDYEGKTACVISRGPRIVNFNEARVQICQSDFISGTLLMPEFSVDYTFAIIFWHIIVNYAMSFRIFSTLIIVTAELRLHKSFYNT